MLSIAFNLNKISEIVLEQGADNIGVLSPFFMGGARNEGKGKNYE